MTGALDIQSEAPDAFTSEDIEILNILADQAAIIIEDARLFSETAQALSEIPHRLWSVLAPGLGKITTGSRFDWFPVHGWQNQPD